MIFEIRIQTEAFDIELEYQKLMLNSKRIGAIVAFVGQVRDTPLELEHYPGMAERQISATLNEARRRWPLLGAVIVHRYGRLDLGAPIVLVLTAGAHRAEAFSANEFLMDMLKIRAPFWKRAPGGWVDAKISDERCADRWNIN